MTKKVLALLVLIAGCGTLASPAEDDGVLPNAKAGPFRPLRADEIDTSITGHPAPFLARRERNRFRSPAPFDIDGDPGTLPIWLYAVEDEDDAPRIVRFTAEDGRSLARDFEVVVERPEEGGVHSPSVVRDGDEVVLYYATAAGRFVARSRDGLSFTDVTTVVVGGLACDTSPSDMTSRDFAVAALPSGGFRLFVARGDSICEAASEDGIEFHPVGADGTVFRSADLPFAERMGFGRVSLAHPFATTATTAEGRLVVRVYFTGQGEGGESFLGLAARYGEDGDLVSAVAPVLGGEGAPREAAVLGFGDFALLYFTRDAGSFPAIAAGVAPATVRLP